MENTTESFTRTGDLLDIPVDKKAQNSTTEPCAVVRFSFEDKLEHKLLGRYMEQSMEIIEVLHTRFKNCHRPLCSPDRTPDVKYHQLASFLRERLVPRNYRAKLFLSKDSTLCIHGKMWQYKTTAAVNEQGILTAVKNLWKKRRNSGMGDCPCGIWRSVLLRIVCISLLLLIL